VDDRDGRGEPGEPEATAPELVPRRGRMRHQDETTTPRAPTLAERRARERAARAAEMRRLDEEAAGTKRRRRVLVGAGVTVGVVALIAVGYSAAQPQEEITAQCVDEETGVIVDDSNCATPAPNTPYYGGVGFYPIFIGLGGRQYHYNYGGAGTVGQQVSGGTTTVPPDGTRVRTSSGSSTVTRGGLGVSRSSTSGGSVRGSKSGGSVRSGSGGSKSGGG
jgi:hypothetical protein